MGDQVLQGAGPLSWGSTSAEVDAEAVSDSWSGGAPALSVLVSTFRRPTYLSGLFDALEAQDLDRATFEVVVVDNGSGDETWEVLRALVERTGMAARIGRVTDNRGPASGRNAAVLLARAPLVAFTDDDCLPEPGWVAAMLDALAGGCRIVQGCTLPDPGPPRRSWDHTITVTSVTGFFETCNLGYRRDDVLAAGGFEALPGLRPGRGGFPFGGEDTLLGWKVARAAGVEPVFLEAAVVRHRIEPRTYAEWLRTRRGMTIFPALVASVPELRARLHRRWFLSSSTARFDLACAGVVGAVARRSPMPLVVALPYLMTRLPHRRAWTSASVARSARLVAADAVGAWSLVRGSVRHRSLVL